MTPFLSAWQDDLARPGPFDQRTREAISTAAGRIYASASLPAPQVVFVASPAAMRYVAAIATARYAMHMANTDGVGPRALAAECAALATPGRAAADMSAAIVAATWSPGQAPPTLPHTPPPWAAVETPVVDVPVGPAIVRAGTLSPFEQITASAMEAAWHAVKAAVEIDAAAQSTDATYASEHASWEIARKCFVGARRRLVQDYTYRPAPTGASRARMAAACSMALVSPALETVVRHGGGVHFGAQFVIFSSAPTLVRRDEKGRLSNRTGPAVKWADGAAAYAVDGDLVPGHIIENPEDITSVMVEAEDNATVRDLMLELYPGGHFAYLEDAGMVLLDSSTTATLYVSTTGAPRALVSIGGKLIGIPPEIHTAEAAERWVTASSGGM